MKLSKILPGFRNLCSTVMSMATLPTSKNLKIGNQVTIFKTITKQDVLRFAELTGDHNPIHISSMNIVHGALLNGLISGVLGTKLPGPGTIVVQQWLKYLKPCYVGDNVEITVEVLSVRKIVKCSYKCVANGERLILEGEAKLILQNLSTIQ